jgi:hypothetical protein
MFAGKSANKSATSVAGYPTRTLAFRGSIDEEAIIQC